MREERSKTTDKESKSHYERDSKHKSRKRKDEDDDYLEGGRRKSARDRSYDSDASSYSSTSPRSKRRHHDKRRSSPNSKHRKHHRHRSRSRSRDSYRSDHRRRRRSRSRSYDRRTTSDSTSQSEPASSALKPITLKDVISANPGISMPEAVMRLNAHNLAVSRGEPPPPLSGSLPVPLTSFAAGNLLGDGGAATKPHREIYVGNLPPSITVPQLTEFFNSSVKQLGVSKDSLPPVIAVWISPDGHYAFVELRTMDEATAALNCLNGAQIGVYSLKIGRPKGYTAPGNMSVLPTPVQPKLTNLPTVSLAPSTEPLPLNALSNVMMISNLPSMIAPEQIRELFVPFGQLKAFNIIKTVGSQTQSAVLEFEDPKVTDGVIAGLDKLDLAGNKLSVQRIPAQTAAVLLKPTTGAGPEEWTTIVCLSNMTTEEDLRDDVSFGELVEDIAHECNKHGIVKFIAVPRTVEEVRDVSLVGKVFVVFTSCEGAHATLQAISGRKFNGKVVEASFISLQYFETISKSLSSSSCQPAASTLN